MRTFISTSIIALMLLVGCTAVQKGATVVKYEKGETPIMTTAGSTGTFALYSLLDTTPKVTYQLEKGEQLGFRRDEAGQLFAVAGKNEIRVDNETYYWRQR